MGIFIFLFVFYIIWNEFRCYELFKMLINLSNIFGDHVTLTGKIVKHITKKEDEINER